MPDETDTEDVDIPAPEDVAPMAEAPPVAPPTRVTAPDPFFDTTAPNQPTSSGRMYITPTPIPNLSPDQQAALQHRLAVATSGRAPIAPPPGVSGAVRMPDLSEGIRTAFTHLPVDQAAKAVETAIQYQGQRGFEQDTQNGMPAAQAMAKWGPMIFNRSPSGIATALRMGQPPQVPQMTPAQVAANQIAQRRMALSEAQAKTALTPLQAEDLKSKSAALREAQRAASAAVASGDPDAMRRARADFNAAKKDYDDFRASLGGAVAVVPGAVGGAGAIPPTAAAPPPGLLTRARNVIAGALGTGTPPAPPASLKPAPVKTAAPPKITTQAQFDALPPGTVYIGKNGKKHRKPLEAPEETAK